MMKKKLTKIGKICWDDLSGKAHVLPLMMKHGIEEMYPMRGKYMLSSDEGTLNENLSSLVCGFLIGLFFHPPLSV